MTDGTWEDAFGSLLDAYRQAAAADAARERRRRGDILSRLRAWAFGPPAGGYLWDRER